MPIKFRLIPKKVFDGSERKTKYYAVALRDQPISTDDLINRIEALTTASSGDVLLILRSLKTAIIEFIEAGYSIDVKWLFNILPVVKSIGVDDPTHFNTNRDVIEVSLDVRPKKALKDALKNARLKQVSNNK